MRSLSRSVRGGVRRAVRQVVRGAVVRAVAQRAAAVRGVAVLAALGVGLAAAAGANPVLTVTPTSVDFGPVVVGVAAKDTLVFRNTGTTNLQLGGTVVSDPDFTVGGPGGEAPPGTVIAPGDSLQVQVGFRPSAFGPDSATLTISSNDPVTPAFPVSLAGSGANGPRVQVTPALFDETIDFGLTELRDLVIRNTGDVDLQWTMSIQPTVAPRLASASASARGAASLEGVRILWDQSHGQSSPIPWSLFVGELESRGAEVVPFLGMGQSITAGLLATYRVYFSTDPSVSCTVPELNALKNWAEAGGGLLLVGDNSSARVPYNGLLGTLGADIAFGDTQSQVDGVATGGAITAHEATAGVERIFYDVHRPLDPVNPPAEAIVRTNSGAALVALNSVGVGRVAVVGDELFNDATIGEAESIYDADNRLLGNQLVDWVTGGLWLRTDLSGGAVAAGDSAVAHLLFDTADLGSGDFDLNVQITSNDLTAPLVNVPAHLTVIGAPEISVNPTWLVFVDTPSGGTSTGTLRVANVGSAELSVTGITSNTPKFAATQATFTVDIGDTMDVDVSFSPDSIGAFTGMLSVESNAVTNPTVAVTVSGDGTVNCTSPCVAPSLRPLDVEGSNGFQFWLDVAVDSNPGAIGAAGFDLNFDPRHMSFANAVNSDGSFSASASEVQPGRVRVGGFSSPAIPAGFSGSLLQLLFTVDCDTCLAGEQSDIFVSDLVDDLAGLAPCCGEITLTECPSGHGDVNADSTLTATDALCANLIWINGNTVPADTSCQSFGDCEVAAADVNCSGGPTPVSPLDALHIYDRALCVLDPVPVSCFAQSNPDPCGTTLRAGGEREAAIFFGEPRVGDGTTVVTIECDGAPPAVGFELEAPAGLTFLRMERGAAGAEWTALEAGTIDGNRVRIGGFDGERRGGSGSLLRLVYAGTANGEFRVTEVADVAFRGSRQLLVSAVPPAQDGIRSVHPNPARGSLTISLGLAAPHQARELRVVDVAGRLVRTLPLAERGQGQVDVGWDGRDATGNTVAAGVYFVALRLDERVWTRKVLLVR